MLLQAEVKVETFAVQVKSSLNVAAWAGSLVFCFAGCATAQPAVIPIPATAPTSVAVVVEPDGRLEALLDALHRRGDTLTDFSADVSLTTTDTSLGEDPKQLIGSVVYQKSADSHAKLHVTFDKQLIGKKTFDQKLEYLLDGGWLTDRDYRRRIEVRRQVMQPGARVDLLKLGEGPFPLPIGQSREDVHHQFDVSFAADSTDIAPHARLTPKASTSLARKFKTIDVWVDPATDMPTRIETVDRNETTLRRTDLTKIVVNAGVKPEQFHLAEVNDKDWTRTDEKFEE